VVFVSQSLADVVGSVRRDLVLESCPTKIFLPNPEAEGEQVRRLYLSIGLNTRQTRMLAMAVPKRQYYYTSPLGRRLIGLNLGPVALSFVGMAGREAMTMVNELRSAHSARWPGEWLRRRGLDEAADTWNQMAQGGSPSC
jgi:type IV secretion system protein VirB4